MAGIRFGRLRGAAAALLLAALLPGVAGCFGKFQITRNVYRFNQDVSADQWMRWFVFLAMNAFPAYPLSFTIDLFVTNSIEFWTGENPVDPTPPRRVQAPDGSELRVARRAGGGLEIAILGPDGGERWMSIAPEGASLAARDAEGRLLARVADVAGRPTFVEGPAAPGAAGDPAPAR